MDRGDGEERREMADRTAALLFCKLWWRIPVSFVIQIAGLAIGVMLLK